MSNYLEATMDIFWRDGPNSVQRVWELQQHMRLEDAWYLRSCFMLPLAPKRDGISQDTIRHS